MVDRSNGIPLVDEEIAAQHWVQISSDTPCSVTLQAKMTVVRNRQVDRSKYHRLVTEEDYLELGDILYVDARPVSIQMHEHYVSDTNQYDDHN
jgi:hypothetical protein